MLRAYLFSLLPIFLIYMRQTDRQTDRPTDIVPYRAAIAAKKKIDLIRYSFETKKTQIDLICFSYLTKRHIIFSLEL